MIGGKLSKKQTKIKVGIYGDYGTRKSTFGAGFAEMKNEDGSPMKLLYIDIETGSLLDAHTRRLEENGVNLDNIYLIETKNISEIHSILNKVINKDNFYELDENGEETDVILLDGDGKPFHPDAIVIDSLSAIAQDEKIMAYEIAQMRQSVRNSSSEKNSKEKYVAEATANVEIGDYNRLKTIGEKLVSEIIRKVNTHVCLIIRDKEEMKKKPGKSMETVATGRRIPDSWAFALYDSYAVVHLRKEIDEDGNIKRVYGVLDAKDRMDIFEPGVEIENPSVKMWSKVIENNIGRQEGNIVKRQSVEKKIEEEISNIESNFKKPTRLEIITTIMSKIQKSEENTRAEIAQKLKQNGISPKDIKSGAVSDEDLKRAFDLLEEY